MLVMLQLFVCVITERDERQV